MEYNKVGTITCEFDYSLSTASFHTYLIQFDSDKNELSRTSLACYTNLFYTPRISLTTTSDVAYITLMITLYGSANVSLYVDNVNLYENP